MEDNLKFANIIAYNQHTTKLNAPGILAKTLGHW